MDIKGTFNSVLRKLDLEANYEYDEEKRYGTSCYKNIILCFGFRYTKKNLRYGPQERFICRITVDGFDFGIILI